MQNEWHFFYSPFCWFRVLCYWRSQMKIPPKALKMGLQRNLFLNHHLLHHHLSPQAIQCQHPRHLLLCLRRHKPLRIMPTSRPPINDAHLRRQEVSQPNLLFSLISILFSPSLFPAILVLESRDWCINGYQVITLGNDELSLTLAF